MTVDGRIHPANGNGEGGGGAATDEERAAVYAQLLRVPLPATYECIGVSRGGPKPGSCAVHRKPSIEAEKIGLFWPGDEVRVTRINGAWLFVDHAESGLTGWVDAGWAGSQHMRPIITQFTFPWQRARGSALYDSVLAHRRKELAEIDLASSDALLEEWTMVVAELDACLRLKAKCDAMGIGIVAANGRGMGGRQRSRSFLGLKMRRGKRSQHSQGKESQQYRGPYSGRNTTLDRSFPAGVDSSNGSGGGGGGRGSGGGGNGNDFGDAAGWMGGSDARQLRPNIAVPFGGGGGGGGGLGRQHQQRMRSRSFHAQPARPSHQGSGGGGPSSRGQGAFAPQALPTEASKVRQRWQDFMQETAEEELDAQTHGLNKSSLYSKSSHYLGRKARQRNQSTFQKQHSSPSRPGRAAKVSLDFSNEGSGEGPDSNGNGGGDGGGGGVLLHTRQNSNDQDTEHHPALGLIGEPVPFSVATTDGHATKGRGSIPGSPQAFYSAGGEPLWASDDRDPTIVTSDTVSPGVGTDAGVGAPNPTAAPSTPGGGGGGGGAPAAAAAAAEMSTPPRRGLMQADSFSTPDPVAIRNLLPVSAANARLLSSPSSGPPVVVIPSQSPAKMVVHDQLMVSVSSPSPHNVNGSLPSSPVPVEMWLQPPSPIGTVQVPTPVRNGDGDRDRDGHGHGHDDYNASFDSDIVKDSNVNAEVAAAAVGSVEVDNVLLQTAPQQQEHQKNHDQNEVQARTQTRTVGLPPDPYDPVFAARLLASAEKADVAAGVASAPSAAATAAAEVDAPADPTMHAHGGGGFIDDEMYAGSTGSGSEGADQNGEGSTEADWI